MLVTKGKCSTCQQLQQRSQDDRRGTAAERGYGYRWQQYVAAYKRAHPLCAGPSSRCQARGDATPTECVDHVKPVSGPDDPLFWDPANHQPLCNSCHSVKTATEDGGFGRSRTS